MAFEQVWSFMATEINQFWKFFLFGDFHYCSGFYLILENKKRNWQFLTTCRVFAYNITRKVFENVYAIQIGSYNLYPFSNKWCALICRSISYYLMRTEIKYLKIEISKTIGLSLPYTFGLVGHLFWRQRNVTIFSSILLFIAILHLKGYRCHNFLLDKSVSFTQFVNFAKVMAFC